MKKMKIKAFFFFLSIVISINTHAQVIHFSDLANLPAARSAGSSANDGENIFMINGFGVKIPYNSEIFKYHIPTDSWSILTKSISPKTFPSAAIIGQKLYVLNGFLPNGRLNSKVEVIDLNDGTVSFTTDNPVPAKAAGIATWNKKIYTFGGSVRGATYSNKLFEFDLVTTTWKELAEMPFAAETKGEIVNGKLYVFGGFNGKALNKMAIYDIVTNTWQTPLEMPVPISGNATAVIGDKIYLTGDYRNLNALIVFETLNNSFKVLTGSNFKGRRHCVSEGINGQLFVIGGNVTTKIKSSISSIQVAELAENRPINEPISTTEIEIIPNSTRDSLNFNLVFDFLRITDSTGKAIIVKRGSIQQIGVKQLLKGVYQITAKRNNKWYRTKWEVLSKFP